MSDKVYAVPADWAKRAYVDEAKYRAMYARSVADPDGFWREQAGRLDWIKPFTKVKNTTFAPPVSIKWFEDGVLNLSANCLDRHLAKRGDQTAILWEPDDPAGAARELAELGRQALHVGDLPVAAGRAAVCRGKIRQHDQLARAGVALRGRERRRVESRRTGQQQHRVDAVGAARRHEIALDDPVVAHRVAAPQHPQVRVRHRKRIGQGRRGDAHCRRRHAAERPAASDRNLAYGAHRGTPLWPAPGTSLIRPGDGYNRGYQIGAVSLLDYIGPRLDAYAKT